MATMKPPNATPPPAADQTQNLSQQQQPQQQQLQQQSSTTTTPVSMGIPTPATIAVSSQQIMNKPHTIVATTAQVQQTPLALTTQQQNQVRPQLQATPQQILTQSTPSATTPSTTQPVQQILHPTKIQANQLPQTGSPIRPTEYLLLVSPGQPGVQGAIRYQALNQSNFLQANPNLLRSINPSQIIRAQPNSSAALIQTQTSQAQTTTMANLQTRPLQIQSFRPAGPRGPITLANGQTIIPSIPIQRHQMMAPRATILQQPTLRQGMGVHPVISTSQPMGLGVQTSMAPTQIIHQGNFIQMNQTATAPSQMTPDDALKKGTSFFHSLLTRMNIQKKKIVMQNLIQDLIDGKTTSAEFASDLQKELNSGPQVQLVPFLDLLLPNLRQSMISGQTKLPGIRPPSMQDAGPSLAPPQPQQLQLQQPPPPPLPVTPQPPTEDSSPSTSSPSKVQSNNTAPKKKKVPLPPGQKSAYAIKKEAREAKKKEKESLAAAAAAAAASAAAAAVAAQAIKIEPSAENKKEVEKVEKPAKPKADKPKRQDKQKKQEKQLESLSSALRDDDDVNDVAAMGGVNLAEESQRIIASGAELVGTQIRSCKDEPFLDTNALATRIARIAKEYNLSEPSKDVVTLISHATQERLKNMVERLGILAEHRGENLKLNRKYEPSTDIKGQVKFLAELDRIEKRRYEEQERELLLRVAKSRSKAEDPEQQKLRQKAKDMQRAEQEEVRQREANETALLAIGPRKKLKTSSASTVSSFSQAASLKDNKTTIDVRGDAIRRVKRVNMRDLQVLMELDRIHLNRLIKITAQ